MVDTCEDSAGNGDRMSDAASSEHPGLSSGRPSCSSCSGSSRPSSGGGSGFRSKCPHCKTKHHRKQPCRQNAMDADPAADYPSRSVVCIRLPSASPSCPHFDSRTAAAASEASSSCGGHSGSRHRKCSRCSSRKRSDHAKRACPAGPGGKDSANLLANLKAFFNKWLDNAKASKAAGAQHHLLVNGAHHGNGLVVLQPPQPEQTSFPQHTVISLNSSFDSDYRLHYNPNSSICSTGCHSTASIPTTLSTTTVSEPPSAAGLDINLLGEPGEGSFWISHVDYDVFLRHNPRLMGKQYLSAQNPLVPSLSCPTKSKSLQSQISKQKDLLCSTWPPSGKRVFMPESEEEFQSDHDDILIERITKEHLYEFNIPFSDIKFNECIKTGSRRKIHRGQWHGEVMIHTYDHLNHKEISKFWEEVQKLSMVRHENIALFMGASMDPPNFAVVTETRKGCTLYEKLHVSREKTAQSFKLNVLRQLAQALGYLHAKGIAVKRLNSKHIFLEPKVKVCLLDFSALEDEEGRDSALSLSSNMVYYLAPEILTASFTIDCNRYCDEKHFSTFSDVFAFGTIMFEVQTGRYPYFKLAPQNVMEAICEGRREDVRELRCSETVKSLIQECWLHSALDRPEMSDINKELQHRNAAHKRHSSSEPENLHRLTFGKVSYL